MDIYDKKIISLHNCIADDCREYDFDSGKCWPVSDKDEIILRTDLGLGLGLFDSVGIDSLMFTLDEKLCAGNRIILMGFDINELVKMDAQSVDYAKFTVVRLKQEVSRLDTSKLYTLFRKIDYLKYNKHLRGYAVCISSRMGKENIRIRKSAVAEGISFVNVGNALISEYMKVEEVEAASIIFAAYPSGSYDFSKLLNLSESSEKITESLNTIFNGLVMDCNSCSQKSLCDEIDGIRQLHEKSLHPSL